MSKCAHRREPVSLVISCEMRAALAKRLVEVSAADLEIRLAEFLKFLQLAANTNAQHLPIGVEIDEVWHAFILETRVYAALCGQIGNFVHHTTIPNHISNDFSTELDDDLEFVVAYLTQFDFFPAHAIALWPALSRLSAYLRIPINEVMRFARGLTLDFGNI